MSVFNAIDLSNLAPPKIIEELSAEQLVEDYVKYFKALDTKGDKKLADTIQALLPSDPSYKIIEACAYRELLLRQRINDSIKAMLVAYATGEDLDHLAAFIPIERKVLDEGDPTDTPPRPRIMESDDDFRKRVVLAPEAFSTAGSKGAYVFHALSVPGVKEACPVSPSASYVKLYIFAEENNGEASQELLNAVAAVFTDDIRTFTDQVSFHSADILEYTVKATIEVDEKAPIKKLESEAGASLDKYVEECHSLGKCVALSGISAALHVPGVRSVTITEPTTNIGGQENCAPFCVAKDLTVNQVSTSDNPSGDGEG